MGVDCIARYVLNGCFRLDVPSTPYWRFTAKRRAFPAPKSRHFEATRGENNHDPKIEEKFYSQSDRNSRNSVPLWQRVSFEAARRYAQECRQEEAAVGIHQFGYLVQQAAAGSDCWNVIDLER